MLDRFVSLALAAGLLALAASTVLGFGQGFAGIGPRLVQFERVTIYGKREIAAADTTTATARTAQR